MKTLAPSLRTIDIYEVEGSMDTLVRQDVAISPNPWPELILPALHQAPERPQGTEPHRIQRMRGFDKGEGIEALPDTAIFPAFKEYLTCLLRGPEDQILEVSVPEVRLPAFDRQAADHPFMKGLA